MRRFARAGPAAVTGRFLLMVALVMTLIFAGSMVHLVTGAPTVEAATYAADGIVSDVNVSAPARAPDASVFDALYSLTPNDFNMILTSGAKRPQITWRPGLPTTTQRGTAQNLVTDSATHTATENGPDTGIALLL